MSEMGFENVFYLESECFCVVVLLRVPVRRDGWGVARLRSTGTLRPCSQQINNISITWDGVMQQFRWLILLMCCKLIWSNVFYSSRRMCNFFLIGFCCNNSEWLLQCVKINNNSFYHCSQFLLQFSIFCLFLTSVYNSHSRIVKNYIRICSSKNIFWSKFRLKKKCVLWDTYLPALH